MLGALEEGYNVALTADVPKVARVAGLGIVKLASASGRPIYPIAIATRRRAGARELGPHDHQSSVRTWRRGRGRAGARAGGCRWPALEAARARASEPPSTQRPRVPTPSPIDCREAAAVAEGCRSRCALYRLLTAAATPLASMLISHRLKHGKEHPARVDERYGDSKRRPPAGPAGVGARRERRRIAHGDPADRAHPREGFNVLCTSGTVTSANLAEQRLPNGRDPPVRRPRYAALRQALLRTLAARSRDLRRIRSLAQSDR